MPHIPWKDRLNIHYKDIDPQHRRLLDILNELVELNEHGDDSDGLAQVFHQLCQYALEHFAKEEAFMAAAGYPDLPRHEAEHAFFVEKLLGLNQAYEASDQRLVEATYEFVRHWFLNHIAHSDQAYAPFLKHHFERATIQALVLDLCDVLCAVDEHAFLAAAAPLFQLPLEPFQETWHRHDRLSRAFEGGLIDGHGFLERVKALAGPAFDEAAFLRAYVGVFTPDPALIDLLRRLKGTLKLALIMDTTPLRYDWLREHLDGLDLFDLIALPFERRKRTSDPDLLQDIAGELGLMSEACIYLTRDPARAESARNALFHGLAYTGADHLPRDLFHLRVAV